MALIDWRAEFSLGVPEVDHEHRELIELINTAHAQLVSEGAEAGVGDFLGEIYAKIAAHFALEERLMRERRYDRYQEHKDDHERLLDEIRDLMDDFEDGALLDEPEFAARLRHWFTEHFRTKDARLHKMLG